MSAAKKVGKKSNRGGARPGAGRPVGGTKEKISVSVDKTVLNKALALHGGKVSSAVEAALIAYTNAQS